MIDVRHITGIMSAVEGVPYGMTGICNITCTHSMAGSPPSLEVGQSLFGSQAL